MLIAKGQLRAAGTRHCYAESAPQRKGRAGGGGWKGAASVKARCREKAGGMQWCVVGPGVPSMGKVMFSLKETS